jgi:hypothetical protein
MLIVVAVEVVRLASFSNMGFSKDSSSYVLP